MNIKQNKDGVMIIFQRIITFISNYVIRRYEISRYNLRFLAVLFILYKSEKATTENSPSANS